MKKQKLKYAKLKPIKTPAKPIVVNIQNLIGSLTIKSGRKKISVVTKELITALNEAVVDLK
jgi:hypothetical protein